MKILFPALLAAVLCGACAAPPAATTPPAGAAETPDAASTLARIRTLAAHNSCSSASQCHSLPLGAKACGGPEAYLPWSSASADGARLQALARRYQAQRVKENAGLASDCSLVDDPGAVCRAGRCQAGGASAAAQ
ncbi:hypothetical protein [Pseudoduganella violacea]|uniref:Lipoprotein n=1 Tax=Pseudoduganella violacea TaxID=1715466 RepID=A0A7W5BAX5_9BURK|nr:hypothetical protein [Pseudoduganella violacea]MBB3119628.1 hypothetical protein [Pseudoduganella violacea]